LFYYDLYGLDYEKSHLLSILSNFKIQKLIKTKFKFLSLGQKRKCAIARTFIKSSPVLLLAYRCTRFRFTKPIRRILEIESEKRKLCMHDDYSQL